ncbi:hypothetical protein DPMN_021758 [Dreissena polymorpha]|uniref:Uncharacterized protein n=1 Tax=Dreissena polymorpha TaxID=45954 RepID=A0A9D4SBB3_DREPO|nr:hypothetical protein DPMN_021758 [Dreissena polymorpha]
MSTLSHFPSSSFSDGIDNDLPLEFTGSRVWHSESCLAMFQNQVSCRRLTLHKRGSCGPISAAVMFRAYRLALCS